MTALRLVRLAACALALALAGCAPPLTVRTSLPVVITPSPNFDLRRPSFVILHHTGSGYAGRALATLTDPRREVSAHYVVERNGTIDYLVDELNRAWHAGESSWGGMTDLNSASIGIEIDNDGEEPYSEAQIASLLQLLADLKLRWKIPTANFIGHGDVAPGRKTDPGSAFPWQRLADAGFGLWCEPPYPPVNPALDASLLLSAFGYDVSNPEAAIAAFKRHFVPAGNVSEMTFDDRSRLACLVQRKLAPD